MLFSNNKNHLHSRSDNLRLSCLKVQSKLMKAFANNKNKKYLRGSNQNWMAVVDLKIRGSFSFSRAVCFSLYYCFRNRWRSNQVTSVRAANDC
jgi:hypothetical protein